MTCVANFWNAARTGAVRIGQHEHIRNDDGTNGGYVFRTVTTSPYDPRRPEASERLAKYVARRVREG